MKKFIRSCSAFALLSLAVIAFALDHNHAVISQFYIWNETHTQIVAVCYTYQDGCKETKNWTVTD